MKRRDFLKTGAMAVVGTAVAASGLIAEATAGAEAIPKLSTLKPHEAQTLLQVCRQIFPHSKLGDAPYWGVVSQLDAAAQGDPSVAKMLTNGVAQVDSSQGSKFVDLNDAQKVEALKAVETTPFFQKVRGVELQTLYSDPAVFKAMGYQGASYSIGGYLHHGFNDLAWLPDPPQSASPKPA
jgi:Gluconate 2-dehydrogenase subunit 3/TAT (twin-arginine translocation) pathway signal sequence